MRALLTNGHELAIRQLPARRPGAGQILLEVHAATVNPVDAMLAAGVLHQHGIVPEGTAIGLGWDAVGVVTEVGADVQGFAVGDRVAAVLATFGTPLGAIADQVVVPIADAAPVPAGLTLVDAAAIGMNALTAAQALGHLGPAAGRTLLVTGGAGALGGFVVELAVRAGWHVTGLARPDDVDFVKARGAELITELGGTYDAVIDAATLQEAALPAVAPGGTIVGVVGIAPLPEDPSRVVVTQQVHPDGAALSELLGLAEQGVLTPRVLATLPLSRAAEAVAATASGGRRGRWVVVPD